MVINDWLVLWNMFYFSHHIGNVIIPTDFFIFQRGRVQTSNQKMTIKLQSPVPLFQNDPSLVDIGDLARYGCCPEGISPTFVWQKENEIVLETRKFGWSKMEKLFDT